MLISLNELKSLVDIKVSDDELFKLIGSRLVEIEAVHDLTPKYKKIYIVKVKKAEPIEGTHLHLCEIDAGKELNSSVDPEHEGFVQVVCGAPNVRKGMLAVWIAPGAIVPATYETLEPFEISARPLRGFMSYGMLAGLDELDLGDDHSGIVSVHPDHVTIAEDGCLRTVRPGDSFATAFDLNDKIIEVENKSLTHRPDCFGLIGFAREVAGILGQKFDYDNSKLAKVALDSANQALIELKNAESKIPLSVEIADFKICPSYRAYVADFQDGLPAEYLPINFESSAPAERTLLLLDAFFAKAGMRSISPLVDLTNKIMLMTGQPLHAFDYDKFLRVGGTKTPEIRVRLARKGEKLTLLDGKEIELNETDIVICSADTPVALAGALGGESTAIDASTKRVIFEVASFSLFNLRKTQMSHGIFSEAITRFTKGRPASDLSRASFCLASELSRSLGGKLIGFAELTDPELLENGQFKPNVVKITTKEINALLGSSYPDELIIRTLENTGFIIKNEKGTLEVTVPLWRSDVHIKEDIIEEVGRLLGFDNLPLNYARRPFVCPELDPMLTLKTELRTVLSDRLGSHELLTYSFVSKSLQERAGENPDDSYQIVNSISPELECFRQSLLPSLLEKVHENSKAGFKDFSAYELNQVSKKSWGLSDENVPNLRTELSLATFGDFFSAKTILSELEKSLKFKFNLKPAESPVYFEPLRSVAIFLGEEKIGELGEIKRTILKRFKLESPVSALTLYLDPLLSAKRATKTSVKLSRFPSVSRDLTFRVKNTLNYADVEAEICSVLDAEKDLIYSLTPVSIFRRAGENERNLSFHLELSDTKKTLDSEQISDIIEKIVRKVKTLGAEVV